MSSRGFAPGMLIAIVLGMFVSLGTSSDAQAMCGGNILLTCPAAKRGETSLGARARPGRRHKHSARRTR